MLTFCNDTKLVFVYGEKELSMPFWPVVGSLCPKGPAYALRYVHAGNLLPQHKIGSPGVPFVTYQDRTCLGVVLICPWVILLLYSSLLSSKTFNTKKHTQIVLVFV